MYLIILILLTRVKIFCQLRIQTLKLIRLTLCNQQPLKMFYMERGAGASNLKIQFNLPVITGDEFRVTKNMLETASGQQIQNDYADAAFYYKNTVEAKMQSLRKTVDEMETLTAREYWPMPTYGDMTFRV